MNEQLYRMAQTRFEQSISVPQNFFDTHAEQISRACLAMAKRFHKGGRLLAFGAGNAVTDAQHISVEFVHPVIVGKRALPALALGTDIATTLGLAAEHGLSEIYSHQIRQVGNPTDIAIGLDLKGKSKAVRNGLQAAREMNLLTIALMGGENTEYDTDSIDFCFIVQSSNSDVVQETHETLYHILWELVHVFFDHKGLLENSETNT